MPRKTHEIEILSTSQPVIGRLGTDRRIERMMRDYGEKYHALRIVNDLLIEDAHQSAQANAPKALLAAINLRNGHIPGQRDPNEVDARGRRLGKRASSLRKNGVAHEPEQDDAPKQHGKRRAAKLGKKRFTIQEGRNSSYGISGTRMTLYLLEHLSEREYIEKNTLLEQLRADGYPVPGLLALNAALGVQIYMRGLAKKKGKAYRLTAAGRKQAVKLRALLVNAGMITDTGYTVPEGAPRTVESSATH